MRARHVAVVAVSSLAALLGAVSAAGAHGLAGKRFFPATLATEDPFVADELSLPTILHIKRPGDGETPPTRETTISGELSKRLSPNLGVGLAGAFRRLDPDAAPSATGFD